MIKVTIVTHRLFDVAHLEEYCEHLRLFLSARLVSEFRNNGHAELVTVDGHTTYTWEETAS